jgi:hypothetical protein
MLIKIKKINLNSALSFLNTQQGIGAHFNIKKMTALAKKKNFIFYILESDKNRVGILGFHKTDTNCGYVDLVYVTNEFRGRGLMYVISCFIWQLIFLHYPEIPYVKWECLHRARVAVRFYSKLLKNTGDPSTSLIKQSGLFKAKYVLGRDYIREDKYWNFFMADDSKILKEIFDDKQKEYDITNLLKK